MDDFIAPIINYAANTPGPVKVNLAPGQGAQTAVDFVLADKMGLGPLLISQGFATSRRAAVLYLTCLLAGCPVTAWHSLGQWRNRSASPRSRPPGCPCHSRPSREISHNSRSLSTVTLDNAVMWTPFSTSTRSSWTRCAIRSTNLEHAVPSKARAADRGGRGERRHPRGVESELRTSHQSSNDCGAVPCVLVPGP
jgi:hypothetical protein